MEHLKNEGLKHFRFAGFSAGGETGLLIGSRLGRRHQFINVDTDGWIEISNYGDEGMCVSFRCQSDARQTITDVLNNGDQVIKDWSGVIASLEIQVARLGIQ